MARPGLVALHQPELAAHISRALDADPALPIAGVFLFGSALGACRPDSDIDLGLVPLPDATHAPTWHVEGRAEQLLGTFEGHVFDANLLQGVLFAFEAVTTGRLVHVRDQEALWDFVERVTRRGWELRRRHRAALDVVLSNLRSTE